MTQNERELMEIIGACEDKRKGDENVSKNESVHTDLDEAVEFFSQLSTDAQDSIIDLIKFLLSEK